MKGDFSRLTFDKEKHYSAVLKQQGRVDLDADWNEQQAINRHHLETEAADVIGCCCAPERAPGFHIFTDPLKQLLPEEANLPGNKNPPPIEASDFLISAGRIYVDGILCENEKAVSFSKQPDLPLATIDTTEPMAVVYLDVWQRHVTALDDPAIREKALGGPDTATRLKTIWQVKVLPIRRQSDPGVLRSHIAKVSAALSKIVKRLDPLVHGKLVKVMKENNKRLRSLPAANAGNLITLAKAVAANLQAEKFSPAVKKDVQPIINVLTGTIREVVTNATEITCGSQLEEWDALVAPSTGTMKAHTAVPPEPEDPCCTIPPGAGYRGLENQLYRVEIHQGNVLPDGTPAKDDAGNPLEPTFKWSRDNGSVVIAILADVNGNTIPVHDLGPDNVRGFAVGQWVEVLDDTYELNGQPGHLVQITKVNPDTKEITINNSLRLDYNNGIYHPKLRRWDSAGDITVEAPATSDDWIPLESGIEVQFPVEDGTYKTGDYWLIPARTANSETINDIEWPLDTNSLPVAQSALGIRHHYCRLALINAEGIPGGPDAEERRITVAADCRCKFSPLCGQEPTKIQEEPAIHITEVFVGNRQTRKSLLNDEPVLADQLETISLICDKRPDQGIVGLASQPNANAQPCPVFLLTVYLPYPLTAADHKRWRPDDDIFGYHPIVLAGNVKVDRNEIQWEASKNTKKWLTGQLSAFLSPPQIKILVGLTLKGNFVWGAEQNKKVFLDGEAFGMPRPGPSTGLNLEELRGQSGDGRRGGNFEMWFWLTS